jgi:hypothetical protein
MASKFEIVVMPFSTTFFSWSFIIRNNTIITAYFNFCFFANLLNSYHWNDVYFSSFLVPDS